MRSPHERQGFPEFRRSPYEVGSALQVQKTSALAILSLISGILSFPMMCLCFLSIPFSLFAIISGHMARGIMRQSNGQYAGMEMASFGLLTGYTSLILMGLFLALGLGITETSRVVVNNRGQSASEVLLDAAEAMLLRDGSPATFSNDAANGDSALLAAHFVETLAEADSLLFAETTDSAADSARTYRAYVQLNDDSCAVLVCVPELERFTESARKTLAQVAWLTAQRTIESTLSEGSDLAVAVYGFDGLQTVMIGEVRTSDEFDAGLKSSSNDRNALIRFFPKPARRESRERVSPAGGDDASMIDTNPSVSELPERE